MLPVAVTEERENFEGLHPQVNALGVLHQQLKGNNACTFLSQIFVQNSSHDSTDLHRVNKYNYTHRIRGESENQ